MVENTINWSVKKWSIIFLLINKIQFEIVGCNKKSSRLDPQYSSGTGKRGSGNIIARGCFSEFGVEPLHQINGIMDRFMFKDILKSLIFPHAEWNVLPSWSLKKISKLVKKWIAAETINILINPIGNLWEILNMKTNREGVNGGKNKLFEA